MTPFHTPVLLHEILDGIAIHPGARVIDATLGGGGYGWEIIRAGGILLGIDTDHDAIAHAREELRIKNLELRLKENWNIVQGNFRDIEKIARAVGFEEVDGIVFDLGVSSYQLDTPQKGFSYRFADAPLDMRLDRSQTLTAAKLIAQASEKELYEIIATLGEEELAGAIAHALVRARRITPILSAGDLVDVIRQMAGASASPGVYARVFQALRIAVNDELAALKEGLKGTKALLKYGGRLAVVSFHSLEDRIVKQFLRESAMRIITKKPIVPNAQEVRQNPRARSAKLRIGERL